MLVVSELALWLRLDPAATAAAVIIDAALKVGEAAG
jgi:hypothetical protein